MRYVTFKPEIARDRSGEYAPSKDQGCVYFDVYGDGNTTNISKLKCVCPFDCVGYTWLAYEEHLVTVLDTDVGELI